MVGEVLGDCLSDVRVQVVYVLLLCSYRAGETSLEETGTSVEDYGGELASWHWRLGGDDGTDGRFCHGVCVCW